MDWTPTETQTAIRDLSKQITRGSPTPWAHLAEAGLLELDNLLDIIVLVEEVGRAGGQVPVIETLLLGAPARQLHPELPADAVFTGALHEASGRAPTQATTTVCDGKAQGTKLVVPATDRASHIVFPAADGLYVSCLADCAVTQQQGTNGDTVGTVTLDGAPATAVGGVDAIVDWEQRVAVGIAALHLGLARQALILTAKYTATRHQFGRPIATFQAVSQRAADAFIDVRAMELTLLQAAWRVEAGLPAAREVAIARHQSSEGSHRVLAAAQHLHGGMGFDRDYPLHRFFLTAKAWEFVGGGAAAHLERLGDLLAETRTDTNPVASP